MERTYCNRVVEPRAGREEFSLVPIVYCTEFCTGFPATFAFQLKTVGFDRQGGVGKNWATEKIGIHLLRLVSGGAIVIRLPLRPPFIKRVCHMRRQAYCGECETTTLHELDPNPVNHILHLLATVLCCGFWLPIWILIALTAPTRHVRCLSCGQILGRPSPKDKESAAAQRAENAARRNEAIGRAANAAGTAAASAAKTTASGVGAAAKTTARSLSTIYTIASAGIRQSLCQVDRIILAMAGDDVFMAWFLRFLLAVAMLLAGGFVLYLLIQLVSRTGQPVG